MPIERIRVLDNDVPLWIQSLWEGGLSDKEIDQMLVHLNTTYAGLKSEELAQVKIKEIDEYLQRTYGRTLPPEHLEGLRQSLVQHYRDKAKRESPDAPLTGHVHE